MNDIDLIRMWMERQGLPMEADRAEFMTRPEGRYPLLLALRTEILKRDVSGFTPPHDLDFRERRRS